MTDYLFQMKFEVGTDKNSPTGVHVIVTCIRCNDLVDTGSSVGEMSETIEEHIKFHLP